MGKVQKKRNGTVNIWKFCNSLYRQLNKQQNWFKYRNRLEYFWNHLNMCMKTLISTKKLVLSPLLTDYLPAYKTKLRPSVVSALHYSMEVKGLSSLLYFSKRLIQLNKLPLSSEITFLLKTWWPKKKIPPKLVSKMYFKVLAILRQARKNKSRWIKASIGKKALTSYISKDQVLHMNEKCLK